MPSGTSPGDDESRPGQGGLSSTDTPSVRPFDDSLNNDVRAFLADARRHYPEDPTRVGIAQVGIEVAADMLGDGAE